MIDGRSVLAIITARGGSKGLPGKNLKPVGGMPMLAWSIAAAHGSRYIDRTILSSEDVDIIATAQDYGCEVPFTRPAEYAADDSPLLDAVEHALDHLPNYDVLVVLQASSPLRLPDDIDGALRLMLDAGAPSVVSVTAVEKSPYWMYTIDADARMNPLLDPELASRQRQQLPPVHVLNGAVYAMETKWLRRGRRFVDDETVAYVMPRERSLDVDEALDLQLIDALMRHQADNARYGTG